MTAFYFSQAHCICWTRLILFSTYFTVEMHSRAVSARSAGYTPARRQTVRLKNSCTQTEEMIDINNADPEQLFSDDIADGPLRQSYSDYQQAEHGMKKLKSEVFFIQFLHRLNP